ncbi:MAG: hypothetical protein ACYC9S_13855 [Leptospirales bacterium]
MKITYVPGREPDFYDEEDNDSESSYALRLPELYAVGDTLKAALERMTQHLEREISKIHHALESANLAEVEDAIESTPGHRAEIIHCIGRNSTSPWGLTGEIKLILREETEHIIAIAKPSLAKK